MKLWFVLAVLLLAGISSAHGSDGCACSNRCCRVPVTGCAPGGLPKLPDGMVPYHEHADLVAAISNLAERVGAIEARTRRAAGRRTAADVHARRRVNELNAILKRRYREGKR